MRILFWLLLICLSLKGMAQTPTMGLIQHGPDAYPGYTLMSNNEWTYLIDNCGRVIQSWESQYKTGHGVYLLPDGDLLRAGATSGNFDAGGIGGVFERYSWEGELEWQYFLANSNQHAHHDLAILPSGNFLCTVWEKISAQEAQTNGRRFDGEVWSERILEIEMLPNNQANIAWEWSVWDHLIQDFDPGKTNFGVIAEHPELLDLNYIGKGQETSGNWLHVNAISYNANFDQVAISSRNLSEIYVIDHSTTTQESASHSGGQREKGGDILYRFGNPQVYDHGNESDRIFQGQHHIDWVSEDSDLKGSFSVFNNEFIENQQSKALVFLNPSDENGNYSFSETNGYGNEAIIRSFTSELLYSDILSGVQVMPNNNLLILEGRSGHIMELNPDNEIVWEYINPVNRNGGPGIQGGTPRFNLLFRAIRYPVDFEGFDNKQLSPSQPIELSPLPINCGESVLSAVDDKIIREIIPFQILGNPIRNWLKVNSNIPNTKVTILNLSGSRVEEFALSAGDNYFNTNHLPNGLYILRSEDFYLKFIKK